MPPPVLLEPASVICARRDGRLGSGKRPGGYSGVKEGAVNRSLPVRVSSPGVYPSLFKIEAAAVRSVNFFKKEAQSHRSLGSVGFMLISFVP
jgi:hypothetical protein